MLSRRLRRAREGDAGWELPDLIVIDGGKGQLGMALAAARDVGIDVRPGTGLPMVGLAKERDVDPADADVASAVAGVAPGEVAAVVPAEASLSAADVPAPNVDAVVPAEASLSSAVAPAPDVPDMPAPPSEAATAPPPGGRKRAGSKKDVKKDVKKDGSGSSRRPDRIFLPNAKDAIPIRPSSAEMFVLQHLRDEAHRFAVAFHRRRRTSLTLRSVLADVPGIGPTRQRALLRHFGSLKKIRDATEAELAAVPGMTAPAAAAVCALLGRGGAGVAAVEPDDAAVTANDATAELDALSTGAVGAAAASPTTEVDAEDEVLENAFADLDDEADDTDLPPL